MVDTIRTSLIAAMVLVFASSARAQTSEPGTTYRANAQRTASDNQAGPTSPKVLWVLKSKDHHIASPVPHGNKLYVSGLGAFNTGVFMCLATDPAAKTRSLWAKTTPLLKQPSVSSPGIFKNYLVFGDGMHQNNGAMLYCMDTDGAAV